MLSHLQAVQVLLGQVIAEPVLLLEQGQGDGKVILQLNTHLKKKNTSLLVLTIVNSTFYMNGTIFDNIQT